MSYLRKWHGVVSYSVSKSATQSVSQIKETWKKKKSTNIPLEICVSVREIGSSSVTCWLRSVVNRTWVCMCGEGQLNAAGWENAPLTTNYKHVEGYCHGRGIYRIRPTQQCIVDYTPIFIMWDLRFSQRCCWRFLDVRFRGQAVQIILGLLNPADEDTMALRGQAVQIILGLLDPEVGENMTLRGHAVQIILGLHDPAERPWSF